MLHYMRDEALETTELQMIVARHRHGERTVVLWRSRSLTTKADLYVFFIRLPSHVCFSSAVAESVLRCSKLHRDIVTKDWESV